MNSENNGHDKRESTKTTDFSTAKVGELVPQPHGGALRNGGTNAGGTGRPKNELRAKLREGFEKALPHIQAALEAGPGDPEKKDSWRQTQQYEWACEMAAKYGLGLQQENENLNLNVERKEFDRAAFEALKEAEREVL